MSCHAARFVGIEIQETYVVTPIPYFTVDDCDACASMRLASGDPALRCEEHAS